MTEIRYLRSPGIFEKHLDQSHFLTNPDDDQLFYLNSISSAIWHLLEQPTSEAQATQLLQTAFPETDPELISEHVASFFRELHHAALIRPLSQPDNQ